MKPSSVAAIAALAALASGAASVTFAQDKGASIKGEKEKCYGVAMAGKNDCKSGPGSTCAGSAKVDFNGADWKYVAKGSCTTMKTPGGMGSLTPVAMEKKDKM